MTTPCRLWTGRLDKDGYGRSHGELVHRREYERAHGPLPDDIQVDHLCFVRACYALDHLEAVTAAENSRRRSARQERCRNDHAFTPENTHLSRRKDGSVFRRCRRCNADAQKRLYDRKAVAA